MAGDGIAEAQTRSMNSSKLPKAISLPVPLKRAAKPSCTVSPLRVPPFVIRRCIQTRWKTFWRWISPFAATIPSGLNTCRRKLTASWSTSSITATLCATSSTVITSLRKVDAHALKEQMLALLHARGAQYPAEHNVGHLYKAPDALKQFYRENDPTNSMNPGIGKTTRNKYWKESPDAEQPVTQASD